MSIVFLCYWGSIFLGFMNPHLDLWYLAELASPIRPVKSVSIGTTLRARHQIQFHACMHASARYYYFIPCCQLMNSSFFFAPKPRHPSSFHYCESQVSFSPWFELLEMQKWPHEERRSSSPAEACIQEMINHTCMYQNWKKRANQPR